MNEGYCCEALEETTKKYKRPLYRSIIISQDLSTLSVGEWAIQMYSLTKSGTISRRGRATIFINFCPFCGKQLREIEEVQRDR